MSTGHSSFLFRSILLVTAILLVGEVPAAAQEEHPIQLALWAPVQLFPEEDAVRGIRLSLYGKNTSVTGFDWGVVSHTTREFLGLQLGLVGIAEGTFTGVQNNWGVNVVEGAFEGLQAGIVNSVDTGRGVQFGGVNVAQEFRGLQLSIVNYAETLDGLQIGLINIIRRGGVAPILPLVNWSRRERTPN